MALKKYFFASGLALCMGVTAGILTKCVGYVDTARVGYVYEDDDYVYYPEYEVYYSQRHHQYLYQDGNTWIRRDAPSYVSISVLSSSPSYQMSFHDSPERHHSEMRRQYPKRGQDHNSNDGKGQDTHKD